MIAGDEYNDNQFARMEQCQKSSLDAAENHIKDAMRSLSLRDKPASDLNYASKED